MKKKVIVAGASGLVGRAVVEELLKEGIITEVLVRKPVKKWEKHKKLTQTIYDYNSNNIELKAEAVICCLGTTIKKAGSKENFEKVDYTYPLQLAHKVKQNGTLTFAIVTSMGAHPSSTFFYNRVKGKVEDAIAEVGFKNFGIFRPSMLLGDRNENRPGELIGKFLMSTFNFLIPAKYKAISAQKVAESMVSYVLNPRPKTTIIENQQML